MIFVELLDFNFFII